jgi:hypothetical protein
MAETTGVHGMSLEDELEPELREIERLALQSYEDFLRQFGSRWDGRGWVMPDPERPRPPAPSASNCWTAA